VLNYVLSKQEKSMVIGGNMAGTTPRELSAEFALSLRLAPDAASPVVHMPLSLVPGETLSDEQWLEAAHVVMRSMGMDPENHQHVLVKHTDRDHEHVHVVASRIGMDGRKWNVSHDVRRMINGTQEAEKALGLTQTKGLESKPEKRTRPEAPAVAKLQTFLDKASADRPDFRTFVDRLEAQGVTVRPAMSKDGARLNGMSFEVGGVAMKGSALGSAYGFGQLAKRLDFDLERDRPLLVALRDGTERPAAPAAPATVTQAPAEAKTVTAKNITEKAVAHAPSRPAPALPTAHRRVTRTDDMTEAEKLEADALDAAIAEQERQDAARARSGQAIDAWISSLTAPAPSRPTTPAPPPPPRPRPEPQRPEPLAGLPSFMLGSLAPNQAAKPAAPPPGERRSRPLNLNRQVPDLAPKPTTPPKPPEPQEEPQKPRRRFGPR